jgi:hypothetical protein
MAQKLAGSLALVTCKEPLKSNLATHLRQFLIDHGFNEVSALTLLRICLFISVLPSLADGS